MKSSICEEPTPQPPVCDGYVKATEQCERRLRRQRELTDEARREVGNSDYDDWDGGEIEEDN